MSKLLWLPLSKGTHLALYDTELASGLSFEIYQRGIRRAKGITRNAERKRRMGQTLDKVDVFDVLDVLQLKKVPGQQWQDYEKAKQFLDIDQQDPATREQYLKWIAEYLGI